jgi:hypothetical protein
MRAALSLSARELRTVADVDAATPPGVTRSLELGLRMRGGQSAAWYRLRCTRTAPDLVATVAGADIDATDRARGYLPYPPSSPSVGCCGTASWLHAAAERHQP